MRSPGYHHVKAEVLRFPKMWYFLGVRLFKGELLAVKVKSNFKKNGSQFYFSGLKRIAKVTNRVDQTCYSFQAQKIKIVAVSFFLDTAFCCRKKLKNYQTLTTNNFALKTPPGKNYHIFRNLRTSAFSWWYPGYGIVFENFE